MSILLGCIAPRGAMHIRPIGASVHYAGTVPMTIDASGPSTDETCLSRDFENLYLVDGTTFPKHSRQEPDIYLDGERSPRGGAGILIARGVVRINFVQLCDTALWKRTTES